MRPFVERFISFLTVLLAVLAVASMADAQTVPDPDPDTPAAEVDRFRLYQSYKA